MQILDRAPEAQDVLTRRPAEASPEPRVARQASASPVDSNPDLGWAWPVPRRREVVVVALDAIGAQVDVELPGTDPVVAFVLDGMPNSVAAALLALPHHEEVATAGRTWVNPTPSLRAELVRRTFGAVTPAGLEIDVRLALTPAASDALAVRSAS